MDDRLKETGRAAYAAIEEMVTALDVDYERLEELRGERPGRATMTPRKPCCSPMRVAFISGSEHGRRP